jgi:hypothetical protein
MLKRNFSAEQQKKFFSSPLEELKAFFPFLQAIKQLKSDNTLD